MHICWEQGYNSTWNQLSSFYITNALYLFATTNGTIDW